MCGALSRRADAALNNRGDGARRWLHDNDYFLVAPDNIPSKTKGVYAIFQSDGKCLYVGQSRCIKKRFKSPYHPYQVAREQSPELPVVFILKTEDRYFLECLAIGTLRPSWNFGNVPTRKTPLLRKGPQAPQSEATLKALKKARNDIDTKEAKLIAISPEISKELAKQLSEKKNPTKAEQHQLTRYYLSNFYLEEVTAKLVLSDKNGQRRSQIKNFEELFDKGLSETREGAGDVRRLIGLDRWIERTDGWYSDCENLEEFKALCLRGVIKAGIKQSLGYTVRKDVSAQQILGELLRQVGVKVNRDRKGRVGIRRYSVDTESLTKLKALVERRTASSRNRNARD